MIHFVLALLLLSVVLPAARLVKSDPYCAPLDDDDHEGTSRHISYGGYVVKHVSVITRHGDRAPTSVCWNNCPAWSCDLVDSNSTTEITRPLGGTCQTGQLTPTGYKQHVKNGALLRKLYIDQQNLLPPHFESKNIYLRSTDYQRTRQSLKALLEGLYSIDLSTSEPDLVHVITRDVLEENMLPNRHMCPVLAVVDTMFRSSDEFNAILENNVTNELLETLDEIFGWGTKKSWISMFDCLLTHSCHGMPFPEGMTPEIMSKVQFSTLWFQRNLFYSPYHQFNYAQISISSFITDLMSLVHSSMDNDSTDNDKNNIKLAFYSGHDETVLPLLISFEVWDGVWPPYASLLQIELLTDNVQNQYFVRLMYNGLELLLPGCDYLSPCPIDEFERITQKISDAYVLCGQSFSNKP